tara:strand:+ start:2583 stop:3860 length:1278 start_codon:yes stop_codon:yes gene_type:complete
MSCNTISIIGLGYIGLPTAALFASRQKQVIGVDINKVTVDTINAGEIHIIEPHLGDIVRSAVDDGYLQAVVSPEPADVFIIAVPTPFSKHEVEGEIPRPDLQYVESAADAISKVLKKGDLVILESTSPVGTTEKMANLLSENRPDLTFPQTHGDGADIKVAYCPERVIPGQVIRELVENDRIIGGMTQACSNAAIKIYKIFVEGACIATNARTAEMAKLTENASRDVGIAFANELSILCETLGINVWELINLANRHPRVNILNPGPGVGGHCIAVDPWFIVSESPKEARLIHTARLVNDAKPDWAIAKIMAAVENLANKKPMHKIALACLGLAFKPNIDDLRGSPSLYVTQKLIESVACDIYVVEPNISERPAHLSNKAIFSNLDDAIKVADIIVVLTNHDEFVLLDSKVNKDQIILDFVGINKL